MISTLDFMAVTCFKHDSLDTVQSCLGPLGHVPLTLSMYVTDKILVTLSLHVSDMIPMTLSMPVFQTCFS
jgi:hypothetical protein